MTIRRQVALAGHVGDLETARRGLEDPDPAVRATALGALRRLEALDLSQVSAALADPTPSVRARAAELAAGLASSGGVDLLVTALDDPDPTVVEAACFALGETSDLSAGVGHRGSPVAPRVVAGLARVTLEHRDPICREAAVAALGALGDRSGLGAVLVATEDKPAVRRRAVLALAAFDGPEVDAALARALDDRDWQVRQAAEDLTGRP